MVSTGGGGKGKRSKSRSATRKLWSVLTCTCLQNNFCSKKRKLLSGNGVSENDRSSKSTLSLSEKNSTELGRDMKAILAWAESCSNSALLEGPIKSQYKSTVKEKLDRVNKFVGSLASIKTIAPSAKSTKPSKKMQNINYSNSNSNSNSEPGNYISMPNGFMSMPGISPGMVNTPSPVMDFTNNSNQQVQFLNGGSLITSGGSLYSNGEGNTPPKKRRKQITSGGSSGGSDLDMMPPKPPSLSDNKVRQTIFLASKEQGARSNVIRLTNHPPTRLSSC